MKIEEVLERPEANQFIKMYHAYSIKGDLRAFNVFLQRKHEERKQGNPAFEQTPVLFRRFAKEFKELDSAGKLVFVLISWKCFYFNIFNIL